ncbi:MAG: hypothetical protein HZB39_11715 [Planctomycetes bacterium]|nr:hypothetical protein [Planctomycetota bacterium]
MPGVLLVLFAAAGAQEAPHLAYAYPAGLQRGTTVVVTLGGKGLQATTGIHASVPGLSAEILERTRPMTNRERNEARETLQQLQKKRQQGELSTADVALADRLRAQLAASRREVSPQLAETVVLRVVAAPDAPCGDLDLRLLSPNGLSNPLRFVVGSLRELPEAEPGSPPGGADSIELPVVMNGRILAGDVDRYRFRAPQGTHLVADAAARALLPFLADAVPGWFQATLAIHDERGVELAFADDRGPDPDPLLSWVAPADGDYVLEIRDALFRGREDFVYRLTIGELPIVTSVFPLGARAGERTRVQLRGFNLEQTTTEIALRKGEVGTVTVDPTSADGDSVPFAAGRRPEMGECEPNDETAQQLRLPVVVNGIVERPGDVDAFAFAGRHGQRIVAEVAAARLGSPLDSMLRLVHQSGRVVVQNDDDPNLASGLLTQTSDSHLDCTLPADGVYHLLVTDTRQKGSPEHAYRLRVGPPQPDFELRVVPSAIQVRAGGIAVVTVHVARREGFLGAVALELVKAPVGFRLDGAIVPGSVDRLPITLTAPAGTAEAPVSLAIEGRARIAGQDVRHRAEPCDDCMQAFAYRHLVPAAELLCTVRAAGRVPLPRLRHHEEPVQLRAGDTTEVTVADGVRNVSGLEFLLRDPLPGLRIANAQQRGDHFVLSIAVENRDDLRGRAGNLIVDVRPERPAAAASKPPRRPAEPRTAGTLPAIPFEVARR